MNALVESGRLEIRGETARDIVFGEVRLPRARGSDFGARSESKQKGQKGIAKASPQASK
jgi:hypothetical protein